MGDFWDTQNDVFSGGINVPVNISRSNCQQRITQDIALVEITFSNQFVTKMQQNVRVTFTDKISNIGNFSFKLRFSFHEVYLLQQCIYMCKSISNLKK